MEKIIAKQKSKIMEILDIYDNLLGSPLKPEMLVLFDDIDNLLDDIEDKMTTLVDESYEITKRDIVERNRKHCIDKQVVKAFAPYILYYKALLESEKN